MQYNRDETVWGSADGKETLIKDLTTSHLVNILNWIKKHKNVYSNTLYPFLEEEAKFRQILAFCTNDAIPVKLDSGWYTVRNQSFFAYIKARYYKMRGEYRIHKEQKLLKRAKLLFTKRKFNSIKRKS